MHAGLKIAIGVAATSLLAWGTHAATGQRYVDGLGEKAETALAESGVEGASVTMQDGQLARIAVLDGDLPPAERARAAAAVRNVYGIADIRWADGYVPAEGSMAEAGVEDCQKKVDQALAGKTITFRSGSAFMPDSSLAVVDAVAVAIKECPEVSIQVSGHTDLNGSEDVNLRVSEMRAQRVAEELAKRGVPQTQIAAKGLGETQPAVEGTGIEADEANRRIEFAVSAPGAEPAEDAETDPADADSAEPPAETPAAEGGE